jgi:peptidoglycan/xylan/chitin deacetylase (PgdA/CDA1 family)
VGLAQIAATARRDPIEAGHLILQRIAPAVQINALANHAARAGLKRPAFVLSFDCDTDRDIDVAWTVHERLRELGILAIYAVPGELLQRGQQVWKKIAGTGAEFLNHGYREHTVHSAGHYVSTLFYERMTSAEIEDDIERGGEAVRRVVGTMPRGFRTPHFGSFRTRAQIAWLHRLLARLGYRYSSSTTPYVAIRHGPFTRRFGLIELPVSGCPDYPMMILDSYNFRFSPGRFGPDDYVRQASRWADALAAGRPLFVNLYADPSQVADWPEFFEAMQRLAPFARKAYQDLLAELSP